MKLTILWAALAAFVTTATADASTLVYSASGTVGDSGPIEWGYGPSSLGPEMPVTDFRYNFYYVGNTLWIGGLFKTAAPTDYTVVLTLPSTPSDVVFAGPSQLYYTNFYLDLNGDGNYIADGGDDNSFDRGQVELCGLDEPCSPGTATGNQVSLTEDGTVTYAFQGAGSPFERETWSWNNSETIYGSVAPEDIGQAYTVQIFADAITSAVPEPATWAMFLAGFGAIGWTLRRQRAVYPLTPMQASNTRLS